MRTDLRRVLLSVFICSAAQAAITERWFSTSAAGDGTGSSWANRAALFDGSNNWASALVGFDFTSNAMVAYVGPGTYTCAQLLQTSTFTTAAPTAATPLLVQACDSSGNALAVPTPEWTAARPCWSTTNMPVIATSGNIGTTNHANTFWRLIKFTASGRNGTALAGGSFDWCVLVDSTSNSAAQGVNGPARVTNCVVQMTGTSFDYALTSAAGAVANVRLEGNASASSGNRRGFAHATTGQQVDRLAATGFVGGGVVSTSTNTGHWIALRRFVLVNNSGNGYLGHTTASQTNLSTLQGGIITDNGGYGVDAGAEAIFLGRNHLRDNNGGGSGLNFANLGNWPTSLCDTDTGYGGNQAARQAALFVDYASGVPANMDLRVKKSSAYWGLSYGVEDEGAPTLPAVGNVLTGSGTYGYASGLLTPTLALPADSDVWYGVTNWGNPSSWHTGTKRASSIMNCEAGNIKSGVVIDNVTGTYAGGGGSTVIIVQEE